MYFAERPLREAHLDVLHRTQDRKLNVQQHANWANRGFALQVNSVLANLTNPQVLERLRLQEKPDNEQEVKERRDDANHFVNLCLKVSMQRAWSMASHSEIQPNCWAGICDDDIEKAKKCKRQIQNDCEAIEAAVAKLSSGDASEAKVFDRCWPNIASK